MTAWALGERLSSTRTWWPRETRRSTTADPMKPAPPVTSTRIRPPPGLCGTLRRSGCPVRRPPPPPRRPCGRRRASGAAGPGRGPGRAAGAPGRPGPRGAHRHPEEHSGVRLPQAQRPPAAVFREAESGRAARHHEPLQAVVEEPGCDLGRVHADLDPRAAGTVPCRGQPLVETAPPLGEHLEAGGEPWSGPAVEGQQAAARAAPGHRLERVGQRRLGQLGRLGRGARRTQPGLDAAGHRLLRHHQHMKVPHRRTLPMSRTARAVPRTVPVTLERPTRQR